MLFLQIKLGYWTQEIKSVTVDGAFVHAAISLEAAKRMRDELNTKIEYLEAQDPAGPYCSGNPGGTHLLEMYPGEMSPRCVHCGEEIR